MQCLTIKKCKLFELQITQTRHSLAFHMEKMSKFFIPHKIRKTLFIMTKIVGTHLQCVKYHYAKE